MLPQTSKATYNWLCTGHDTFTAMVEAIERAAEYVSLETYIYAPGALGETFLKALVRASQRGVKVRVLVDALGSVNLPTAFWNPLTQAGGEARFFNPISLHRLGIRNHRKMLACDDRVAFVGGFNIAPEYEGDGVSCGWCDIGLRLEGELVHELAVSFDEMFERAEFKHKRFARLRRPTENTAVTTPKEQLLFSGPGRGSSPIKTFLRKDFAKGNKVQVVAAYFLPTWRLRRELARVAQRGGTVQLLLAGKSDVRISQLAGRSLYPRFLRRGVQIFEYQPQVLHAKLIIVDDIVYVGSANLDQRSLNINYELVVRFQDPEVAQQAREVFDQIRSHSQEITLDSWRGAKGLWRHLKESWAYFLLVRIDPYIARRQWRSLPD